MNEKENDKIINEALSKNQKEGVEFLLKKMSDYHGDYYKTINKDACDLTKDILLSKYVKKIDLETEDETIIETHSLPIDSWKLFGPKNLLNSAKTKFVST